MVESKKNRLAVLEHSLAKLPICLKPGEQVTWDLLSADKQEERREFLRGRAERAARGLKGFVEWMIKDAGLASERAMLLRSLAWGMYEDHGGNPAARFYDLEWMSSCTYSALTSSRSALRHLGTWILSSSRDRKDQEWAREQLRLMSTAPCKGYQRVRRPTGTKVYADRRPLTSAEMDAILESIDEVAQRMIRSTPWGREIMRLTILSASGFEEVARLRRQDIESAVARGRKGWIPVWAPKTHNRRRARAIPLVMVKKEALKLLQWPWPWDVIADIVAPHQNPAKSLTAATTRIGTLSAEIAEVARRKHGLPNDSNIMYRARYWVWAELMRQKRDWVLLQSFVGRDIRRLKTLPFLREAEQDYSAPGSPADDTETDAREGVGVNDKPQGANDDLEPTVGQPPKVP